MKRFAANRVCWVSAHELKRNQVVELDNLSHEVLRTFSLQEEVCHTEWIGGIILLAETCPQKMERECFAAFLKRVEASCSELGILHAYHITAFDVNSMEFTTKSRIVLL